MNSNSIKPPPRDPDGVKYRLRIVATIAVAGYGLLLVYLCIEHVRYPGFLEPLEGASLRHIELVAQGQPPYPRPDATFIGLPYMPLYYAASAPFYLWFGDSFAGPRLVSCISALGAGAILWWMTRRESGRPLYAWIALGLYCSAYVLMDAWLTCALPDSFLLLWVLLGYCLLAYGTRPIHDLAWILCFTLAFWTKQPGALFFGFAVVYALFFRDNAIPRWSIVLGIVLGGPVAYYGIGEHLGDGFFYLTLELPGRWDRSLLIALRRIAFVLACYVPYLTILSWFYVASLPSLRDAVKDPLTYFTAATLVVTTFTLSASGGSNNHFIPLIAILCVTSALGAQALASGQKSRLLLPLLLGAAVVGTGLIWLSLRTYGAQPRVRAWGMGVLISVPLVYYVLNWTSRRRTTAAAGSDRPPLRPRGVNAATLLIAGQLVLGAYAPTVFLPSDGYRTDLAAFQESLANVEGEIAWRFYGNAPQALTGKKLATIPGEIGLEDVQRQKNAEADIREQLSPLRDRLREAEQLHILTSGKLTATKWQGIPGKFELVRDYGTQFDGVQQITRHWFDWGTGSFPRRLYRWRPDAASAGRQADD